MVSYSSVLAAISKVILYMNTVYFFYMMEWLQKWKES